MNRLWMALALALALSNVIAARASAQTRVAVHDFYGPEGDELRSDVANMIERQEGVVVVPKREVSEAAQRLGVDSFSPEGRKAVAQELLIAAWITGVVRERHNRMRLTIAVYDGAEHVRVGRTSISGRSAKSLKRAIQHHLWDQAKDAVMLAVAPLPPGRAPIDEDEEEKGKVNDPYMPTQKVVAVSSTTRVAAAVHDDSALAPPLRRQEADALRAVFGFGSPYRSFSYSDPITSTLGDYQLGSAPMLDIALTYHPGRHMGQDWRSYLGLDLAAQVAFGGAAEDRAGNQYEARYGAYRLGLRGRIPVGKHAISAFSGYTIRRFLVISRNKDIEAPAPDVDYRTLRTGLGSEFALSDALAVALDVAWHYVLSVGEVGRWFPRSSAAGLELGLSATYALSDHFFARASAAYQRTAFDFHSRPGDERAAGGATDQFITMSVGAGVSL